ncbi:hypothetical protein [Tateyamaria omphalii]|uniref:hypothetical protein n=1 Tax=Tateyamaria omphalii TaxID=299262 RepID=UPI0016724923|nr:hypothetical protein [Tateyamaria omphalii]
MSDPILSMVSAMPDLSEIFGVRTARAENPVNTGTACAKSVNIRMDQSYAVGSGQVLIILRLGAG